MSTEVKVPSLGESITSGILAAWHVKDGDYVEAGQNLYDLETDKITSEGAAEVAGKISLSVAEGDEVEIGQTVATIDESAEAPASGGESEPAKEEKAEEPAEDKKAEPEKNPEEDRQEAPTSLMDAVKAGAKESEEKKKAPSADQPLSPAVRRIAEESDVDPSQVEGSGKAGRVTKGDMLAEIEKRTESKPSAPAGEKKPAPAPAAPKPSPEGRTTRKKMTPLRRRIAERLVSAQQTAAILTTFNEVDMSGVLSLRKKHQEAFVAKHGFKLGFMSFFIKAAVYALKEIPQINAQIEGDEIIENHFYDIGVAVGTKKGLMVPVIRDCDQLTFAGIEQQIIEYAQKARDGKITIDDLQGGVFTISNGGIFGSMLSTPILNQPQSGILGMHATKERAVVVNGEIVIRPMMYLALSYDHRLVDGSEAVTFLVKIKEAIEDPTRLMLEV